MEKHWFDTVEGKLVVGQAAVEERMQQSSPGDIVPLRELLLADELPAHCRVNEQLEGRRNNWQRNDFINFGHWALSIISSETPQPLVTRHLRRFVALELFPSTTAHVKHFGTLANYQAEIDSPVGYERSKYTDWSVQDFIDYAQKIHDALPANKKRPLGSTDFEDRHAQRQGPSYTLVLSRTGGLGIINEHLGYPNIGEWKRRDYVEYGVKLVEVNGPHVLVPGVINLLASRHRGPWFESIRSRFTKWSVFKQQVMQSYENNNLARQSIINCLTAEIEDGRLPGDFKLLPPDELLMASARYKVAKFCIPDIDDIQGMSVATDSTDLIPILKRIKRSLNAADIETAAVTLELFDYIWPLDAHKKHLKVTHEDLAIVREKERLAKQATRKNH